MRRTRKQRLIAMRKTIDYHPLHPRQMRWEHFNVLDKKVNGKWTVKKTRVGEDKGRRAATTDARRMYQELKKVGV